MLTENEFNDFVKINKLPNILNKITITDSNGDIVIIRTRARTTFKVLFEILIFENMQDYIGKKVFCHRWEKGKFESGGFKCNYVDAGPKGEIIDMSFSQEDGLNTLKGIKEICELKKFTIEIKLVIDGSDYIYKEVY